MPESPPLPVDRKSVDSGSDVPESGVPGSGAPGSVVPESGAPGSGAPGSGAPGSGVPAAVDPAAIDPAAVGPDPVDPVAVDAACGAAVADTLDRLRARTPLVHSITNLVVANLTANALLAIGASPAMVQAAEESAGFARIADALVINLGTIDAPQAESMRLATAAARDAGTPWVLDPVAVGALPFRSAVAVALLANAPAAIRGNASEILALEALSDPDRAGTAEGGRGVDSAHPTEAAAAAARALALRTGAAVTVSGAIDLCTDGARLLRIGNGDPMMTRVTGLGCTATALLGACLAVEPDALVASAHAAVLIGLAGELAAGRARGPGSLQVELLDALFRLDRHTLLAANRLAAPGRPGPV